MLTIAPSDDKALHIPRHITAWYCKKAYQAMLVEVNLSPKPGLVDRNNCGAHQDMVLDDFYRSARAIQPWLEDFMEEGAASALFKESCVLDRLRPIGLACEKAMFRATSGVNTHKGTIFSLGLFCAAIGRRYSLDQSISPYGLSKTVAAFCRGLTLRELLAQNDMDTAGKRLYRQFGLTGARGEAEAGYPLVISLALPHYYECLAKGVDHESALLSTLLILIASNDDTNVASRGGIAGLKWIRQKATCLLQHGRAELSHSVLEAFDRQCIARNLSPGGSADLLVVTWFLAEIASYEPELMSLDILNRSNSIVCVT